MGTVVPLLQGISHQRSTLLSGSEFRCTDIVKYSGSCLSRNSFEPTFVFGIKGYSVYTGSITKDFLYCLVYAGFDLDRLHCATKSCPQEATPIVSPFFQNRRDGLVREGLLYILAYYLYSNGAAWLGLFIFYCLIFFTSNYGSEMEVFLWPTDFLFSFFFF